MTDQHPLTDEMCKGLVPFRLESEYDYVGMRTAYDKGFHDAIECIRKAGIAHYSALCEVQENFYRQEDN